MFKSESPAFRVTQAGKVDFPTKTGGKRRRMPRRRGGAGIGNHSTGISESNPSESDSDDSEHRLQKTPSQNMLTASGSREYHWHAPSLTGSMRLRTIQATGRVRVRAGVLRGNLRPREPEHVILWHCCCHGRLPLATASAAHCAAAVAR